MFSGLGSWVVKDMDEIQARGILIQKMRKIWWQRRPTQPVFELEQLFGPELLIDIHQASDWFKKNLLEHNIYIYVKFWKIIKNLKIFGGAQCVKYT